MRGFYSNRRIYIDGQVLCQEMDQVKFYYNTDFQMTNVQDSDGEDVYVYLTAGEDHTITWRPFPVKSETPCGSWMPLCWI